MTRGRITFQGGPHGTPLVVLFRGGRSVVEVQDPNDTGLDAEEDLRHVRRMVRGLRQPDVLAALQAVGIEVDP